LGDPMFSSLLTIPTLCFSPSNAFLIYKKRGTSKATGLTALEIPFVRDDGR
jgi:hypothetical protein